MFRTKDGTPQRLLLRCEPDLNNVVRAAGMGTARWRKREAAWSLPVDPHLLASLAEHITGLIITQEVMDYMESLKVKQERVLSAVYNTAPLFPEDRLWDFQRASVRFLEEVKRGMLAHEMGTGKTVIACAALECLQLPRVVLVCPNSVKWSWIDHLLEWTSREDIYVVDVKLKKDSFSDVVVIGGSKNKREEQLLAMTAIEPSYILIINYDQLRYHRETLLNREYDLMIADEAHRLKNKGAQRTQVAHQMTDRSEYVWLLTGTPMRNEYTDYWSLLRMSDPVRFPGYWNFLNLYIRAVPNLWGSVDIIGLRDTEQFNRMLATYMFRKTKEEAMPDLPEKQFIDRRLPLNPKQELIYNTMEKEFIMWIKKQLEDGFEIEELLTAPTTLAQLTRLRQICLTPAILDGEADSAKLDAIEDMLEDIKESHDRVIIYSCYRSFLVFVELLLRKKKIPYGMIVGGQSGEERDQVKKQLDNGEIQVILGTIQSMGEGMNLQSASVAVFCDIDWVPAVNEQAEDRIHRGEIVKSPTIIRLYHPNTIETDIRSACKRKTAKAENTLGALETIRSMMSREK